MKNGFSLIELMITVAIIGILSLIAYPVYNDYVIRVRVAEAIHEASFIQDSLLEAYMVHGVDGLTDRINGLCDEFKCIDIPSIPNWGPIAAHISINGHSARSVHISLANPWGPRMLRHTVYLQPDLLKALENAGGLKFAGKDHKDQPIYQLVLFGASGYMDGSIDKWRPIFRPLDRENGMVKFCGQRYSFLGIPRQFLPPGCRDGQVGLNSNDRGIKNGAI